MVFSVHLKADGTVVVLHETGDKFGKTVELIARSQKSSMIFSFMYQPQKIGHEMVPRKRRAFEPEPPASVGMFRVDEQRMERFFCDDGVHRFPGCRFLLVSDSFLFKDENGLKERVPGVQLTFQMVQMLGTHRKNRFDGIWERPGRFAEALPQKASFPHHIATTRRVATPLEFCTVYLQSFILL